MIVKTFSMPFGTNIGGLKANPPFNEMRQDFAAFKKDTLMAPWILDRRIYPNFLRGYFDSLVKSRHPVGKRGPGFL
jgi:hypothetical protein